MSVERRTRDLNELLSLAGPIRELAAALQEYPWDSEVELVVLKRSHVATVLRRYLDNDLDETAVTQWAEAIECRDDIGHESVAADWLDGAIHELATPETQGRLTEGRARQLLAEAEQP